MSICIDSRAEEEEDDVSRGDLDPLLDTDMTHRGRSCDCVPSLGIVDSIPRVLVGESPGHLYKEYDGVNEVEGYDNQANQEEADEA